MEDTNLIATAAGTHMQRPEYFAQVCVWCTRPAVFFVPPPSDPARRLPPTGAARYASIVSAMEQNLRSVVDYPAVALSVATYGKQMMAEWISQNDDWKTDIHKQGCV